MSSQLVGKVILNQFRVDAFLDAGGTGSVYKVWDLRRNVALAMKVLHGDLGEDPRMLKSFQREALALQKLAHPNIVPFYGLYQSDDFAFILERFIDGPTLKEILKQKRGSPCSIQEALVYLKAVSSALGYAHANGVVHCDMKPGNVMIDRGGNVYLADFGIARHAGSTITTMAGAGTPAYMAPEQIRAEAVSSATDIYTLGLVAYELLAGRRPFSSEEETGQGKTLAEQIRHAHLAVQPPDPRQFRPELPRALSAVLLRSLAKNPAERFPTTLDFFNALCRAVGVDPEAVSDRVETRAEDRVVSPMPPIQAPWEKAGQSSLGIPRARNYWWLPLGLVILAAAAVILPNVIKNAPPPADVEPKFLPTAIPDLATEVVPTWTATAEPATAVPPTAVPPTLQVTDTPVIPQISSFRACLDECDDNGNNSTREFPEKIQKIYLLWSFQNIPVGSEYVRIWSMDGREWVRYQCSWPGPENGTARISLREPDGLHSGTWEVKILVDGKILLQEQINVAGNHTYWYPVGTRYTCYDG